MKATIVAIVLAVALLAAFVLADQMSSCRCYFTGPCIQAEDGTWVRYYQCTGSCFGYSDYERYPKCANPDFKPRELFQDMR